MAASPPLCYLGVVASNLPFLKPDFNVWTSYVEVAISIRKSFYKCFVSRLGGSGLTNCFEVVIFLRKSLYKSLSPKLNSFRERFHGLPAAPDSKAAGPNS